MQKKWISADEPKLYYHPIGKYSEFKWKLAKFSDPNRIKVAARAVALKLTVLDTIIKTNWDTQLSFDWIKWKKLK